MYQNFNIQKLIRSAHTVYTSRDHRTNSDYLPKQHKLNGSVTETGRVYFAVRIDS
jgi:hypothetical protein